jgi:hypothetical protein
LKRPDSGTELPHRRWVGAFAVLVSGVLALWWTTHRTRTVEVVYQPPSRLVDPAPICPWREPERDVREFFPEANRYETATRILSGKRLELQERLGRAPAPDEASLQLHEVFRGVEKVGTVLTRRVRGEHGAIELVLAVDGEHCVRGWRVQRLREPETVVAALESAGWRASLSGKSADVAWRLGQDIPDLPSVARVSGMAVLEGIRSLLVLLAAADK